MRSLVIALTFAVLPLTATAQALNYNHLEGALAFYPDASGQDYLGIDLRASHEMKSLHPNLFAYGGYKFLSDDVDLTQIHFGAGYRFALNDQTEAWAGAGLDNTRVKVSGHSDSDLALGLRAGLRHPLSSNTELGGTVRIVTGDYDYTGFAGTLRHKLNNQLVLLGEVDFFDGDIGFLGGLHFPL